MKVDVSRVTRTTLKDDKVDLVFNKVWEVTCMSWPETIPEKMDRTKVRLLHAEQRLPRHR